MVWKKFVFLARSRSHVSGGGAMCQGAGPRVRGRGLTSQDVVLVVVVGFGSNLDETRQAFRCYKLRDQILIVLETQTIFIIIIIMSRGFSLSSFWKAAVPGWPLTSTRLAIAPLCRLSPAAAELLVQQVELFRWRSSRRRMLQNVAEQLPAECAPYQLQEELQQRTSSAACWEMQNGLQEVGSWLRWVCRRLPGRAAWGRTDSASALGLWSCTTSLETKKRQEVMSQPGGRFRSNSVTDMDRPNFSNQSGRRRSYKLRPLLQTTCRTSCFSPGVHGYYFVLF